MADAARTMANLKNLGERLRSERLIVSATLIHDAADLLERLAAEIERLTPRPMTDRELADLLNEMKFMGGSEWERRGNLFRSRCDEDEQGNVEYQIGRWMAEAVAEKLEREKEAARG